MSDDKLPAVRAEEEHSQVQVAEPIPDPGIEPHEYRITDIDPKAADRVERQVATMFTLAGLLALGSCVAYFAIKRDAVLEFGPLSGNANNMIIGLCLGLALFLIGAGAIQWAKKLMVDEEISEDRHDAHSTPEQIADITEAFQQGVAESGFTRRKLIRRSLFAAMGLLGLPAIVLLRDLGPLPGRSLYNTIWAKGIRVVNDVTDRPIKPSDMVIGQLVNAAPANLAPLQEASPVAYQNAKAKSAVIVVRIKPSEIQAPPGRENWGVDGILCYSKICTHVGCPISLYEQTTHHVLCPCHQSTFDLADGAKVVFGPAARPLPQLPLAVDSEGYLVAQSGFTEPVGPSFWERG
ncbi:Rieske 2Fe-2S domain-containing protein [Kribbella sp. NPDC026596]|uniref:cytochrome bc1 complex Rieske iron-sulfur subunit n=1 Tax=Kribbella sp. NPDC026596 TaxID=3155122 RepID=UPI0033D4038F